MHRLLYRTNRFEGDAHVAAAICFASVRPDEVPDLLRMRSAFMSEAKNARID